MYHIVYFYHNAYSTVARLARETVANNLTVNLNLSLLDSNGKGIYIVIFVSA